MLTYPPILGSRTHFRANIDLGGTLEGFSLADSPKISLAGSILGSIQGFIKGPFRVYGRFLIFQFNRFFFNSIFFKYWLINYFSIWYFKKITYQLSFRFNLKKFQSVFFKNWQINFLHFFQKPGILPTMGQTDCVMTCVSCMPLV